MTLDHTERPLGIQTAAKLPPEDIWLQKNFFERDDFSAVSCHQAQADLSSVRRRSQIVRHFFQKGKMSQIQILRIVNDDTFSPDISHRLNQPGAPYLPGHSGK